MIMLLALAMCENVEMTIDELQKYTHKKGGDIEIHSNMKNNSYVIEYRKSG